MKLLCRTSACFALTLSGLCCSAQQTAIRFPAFEESPTYLASDEGTNGIPSTSPTVVSKSSGSATAVMMMTGSVHAPAVVAHRSIGLSVFVVNMIQISAAGLDIAMTHRCIAGRTCKEGNPMMPSSLGGQLPDEEARIQDVVAIADGRDGGAHCGGGVQHSLLSATGAPANLGLVRSKGKLERGTGMDPSKQSHRLSQGHC